MSAPVLPVSLRPNSRLRREARSPVSEQMFEKKSVSSSSVIPSHSLPVRVAVVGNHLPRQWGIATFTTDLCDAIAAEYGTAEVFVLEVNDPQSRYSYPARVRFELTEGDLSTYKAAADFLNSSDVDLVCLQHEYRIYGGKAGSHVLRLLQHLKMPVVTTLHTVLCEPDIDQLIVLQEIAARSDRLIVMSEHSSQFLQDVFRVPGEKIDLIPHGIPDLPFAEPAMRERAYVYARHMVWNRVAQSYMRAFVRARSSRMPPARVAFPLQTAERNGTSRLINI